jgi:hypothetical protein
VGADRELYRIGVTPNCPVHQITVGGHCFPRRTEKVSGYGAQTKRNEIQGSIVLLEPGDIDRIRSAAKERVIRSTRGKKVSAKVYHKKARNYRPQSHDQEVVDFLYIKKEETNPIYDQSYETLGQDGGPKDDPIEEAPAPVDKVVKKKRAPRKAKAKAPAKVEAKAEPEAKVEEAPQPPEEAPIKKPVVRRRGGRIKE